MGTQLRGNCVKPRSLRLGYFNANGISTQRDEIATFLRDHQLDIFLIQETFLKPHRRDPKIANYRLVRNDRTRCHGGGTLIYYKKDLHCIPITLPDPTSYLEYSACRLGMTGHQSITIISAYCPPPSASSNDNPVGLKKDLKALFGLSDSIILAGDLNAKNIAWNSTVTNPRGRLVLNLSTSLQYDVIAPMTHTHFPGTTTHNPDVLDIALLKNVNLRLNSIETLHELDSDHRPVIVNFTSRSGPPDQGQPIPTKKVIDWRKVSEKLKSTKSPQLDSIPDHLETVADTTAAIDSLTAHVQSVLNECSREVPVLDIQQGKLPDDIRKLITEKNAAVRAYGGFPCDAHKAHMRKLQRAVTKRIAEHRSASWENTLSELEPNHHAYWHLQRKLRSTEETVVPPLIRPDKKVAFENTEKAECLAASLELQCSPSSQPVDQAHIEMVDAEVERRTSLPPVEDPDVPLPPVTTDEVEEIIKKLHHRKAPGLDGITNKVIKMLPAQIIILMTAIFNAALSNNIFPQVWKQAAVIGIPKPGKPKSEPTSYRPISLLSTFGKVYERIIYKRLRDFAESKSLIPEEQFGFRSEHSCVQQVHRIVEHTSAGFQRGYMTGAVFFDIAKAFDKVWHNGLIYKLYKLGVPDRLVLILRDWMSNRTFRYRIEGELSAPHPIRAGVPQGSVLSPLNFTLYTSDIPKDKTTQLALFADDTALYCTGRLPKSISLKLQKVANTLGEWFRLWRIEVNPDKSQAVLFSRPDRKYNNKFKKPISPNPITMYGKPIPWEEQAKYLGVILDNHLTFAKHIQAARSRAAFAMGRLHGMVNARSKLSLRCKLRIFTAVIRPIMTYACAVFAHTKPHHLRRLQVIQNRFLRKITGAPWFVRNQELHLDMKIPTIQQFTKRLSKRFFETAEKHQNPLIKEATRYVPSKISRVRRPRHTLITPDDATTLLQESRRETSTLKKRSTKSFHPRRRGPSRNPRKTGPDLVQSSPRIAEQNNNNDSGVSYQFFSTVGALRTDGRINNSQDPACPLAVPSSDALSRGPTPPGVALSAVA